MLLLIGAGAAAQDYAKALRHLGVAGVDVLSRRHEPAAAMCQTLGLGQAYGGGLETLPTIAARYDGFIIASPIETLLPYLDALAGLTSRPILVEKPVALSSVVLAAHLLRHPSQQVMVALNRLFYPSVQELIRRLAYDPVRSVDFAFTEWLHRVNLEQYAAPVLARWGIANSIHVTTTVFDLIGLPAALHAEIAGRGDVAWHPAGSAFLGAGRSERGVPFSYAADWLSAGRWSAAFRTAKGSYHLEPFEGLSFCAKGSIAREVVVPVWSGETKCGFDGMLRYWLDAKSVDWRFTLAQMQRQLGAIEAMLYRDAA